MIRFAKIDMCPSRSSGAIAVTKTSLVFKVPMPQPIPAGGRANIQMERAHGIARTMRDLLLRPEHDLAGALFRNEAGWNVPAGYGSIDAEVRAVRAAAGIIDLSDRAKIELTGSERIPFLDGLVTADVKVIAPGTSAYALLLNERSRVLGDLRVYAFPESLVLDIEAAQKTTILGILEKARVSDDVEFRDLGTTGHLGVHGPRADDAVTRALGVDVRGLAFDTYVSFPVDKHHVGHIAR